MLDRKAQKVAIASTREWVSEVRKTPNADTPPPRDLTPSVPSPHRRQILSQPTRLGKPDAFPEQTGKFWQSAMTLDHPIGGSMRPGKQMHGRADQFREIADLELVLELRAEVDHSLITDIEFIGDVAVGLAFR